MKSGPGYPIPLPMDNDEPWKSEDEKVKYVPLQVKEGDLAVFLQGGAYEVMYQGEKYFIVLLVASMSITLACNTLPV